MIRKRIATYCFLIVCCFHQFTFPALCQETLYKFEQPIKQIASDNNGKLYVVTNSQLCLLEGNKIVEECFSVENSVQNIHPYKTYQTLISDTVITTVKAKKVISTLTVPETIATSEAQGDEIFIGTTGQGLWKYTASKQEIIQIGLEEEFINDLWQTKDQIWIALDDGIAVYDLKSSKFWYKKLHRIIKHIVGFADQTVLAIGEFGELFKLNSQLEVALTASYNDAKIKSVSVSDGSVYFLSDQACLEINNQLQISEIAKGSYTGILALPHMVLLAQNEFLLGVDTTLQYVPLTSPAYSLFAENDNLLWVGTNGRLLKIKNNKITRTLEIPTKIKDISVSALLVTDRYIFAGTMGDGLFVYTKNGVLIKHILSQKENNKNNIIQLKIKDGLIWVGYLNGLLTLNPKTLTTQTDYSELIGNNYLYAIWPRKKEDFFIGTSSEGILHFDHGTIRKYITDYAIHSLHISDGTLLAGTENNGLYALSPTKSSRAISSIKNIHFIAPVQNSLLVGTNLEIYWIDSDTEVKNEIKVEGLENIQLNAFSNTVSNVFVGYANGVLKINKSKILKLQNRKTYLNPPQLYGKPIPPNTTTFDHTENSLTFTYHPKTFYQIKNALYKYRLVGLDSTWQETQQHKINFYNLKPGAYRFEVGTTPVNQTTNNYESFSFVITAPYYKRWWFITLALISLGVLVFYLIRRREQLIITKEVRERERIRYEFEKLKNQIDPHFLFNSLNSLSCLIEENPKSAVQSVEKLSTLYRDILKYEKVDLIDLATEIQLAQNYFHIHKLRFENFIVLKIEINSTKRLKVVPLSCQFLIENAIKHNVINSQNTLCITIYRENDYLIVTNPLNKKRQPAEKRTGLGIENLQNRYKFFTKRPVIIEKTATNFTVKLPLIYE